MNRQQQILRELDEERFGWFHVRAVLVSGVGFFTDAYDLFIINLVVPMLGYVYFQDNQNQLPPGYDGLVKGSAAVGTLLGQLVFGALADKLGRKRMYGLELMIMIVATFGSAMSASTVSGMNVVVMLSIWRFILGVGIGGDYPLSAVITSEFASKKHRGMMIAAVFAMQGVGILVASLVAVIVLACFKPLIEQDTAYVDYCWRICLGLGGVPALVALYYRLTIPETPRFTFDVEKDGKRALADAKSVLKRNRPIAASSASTDTDAAADNLLSKRSNSISSVQSIPVEDAPFVQPSRETHSSWSAFKQYFGQWVNLKVLLGCSIAWFALDVAFYGINLNQSVVLTAIGYAPKGASPFDTLFSLSVGNLIINLMGTVPAYWVTVFLIDRMGRLPIQNMGFAVLTVVFVILASAYHLILEHSIELFIFLFTVAQFFFNFGPNVTTFVIPGEVFPTRFRSTGHGISAASGKLGAILAIYAFGPLKNIGGTNAFMPGLLGIFGVFMFIGLLATLWVPETKGRSLEELSGAGAAQGDPRTTYELPSV